jgi:hypothetical protein
MKKILMMGVLRMINAGAVIEQKKTETKSNTGTNLTQGR